MNPLRRQKVEAAFAQKQADGEKYARSYRDLPPFVQHFAEKHQTLFWATVFLTPILFAGLKEFHKKSTAEAEARRRKE